MQKIQKGNDIHSNEASFQINTCDFWRKHFADVTMTTHKGWKVTTVIFLLQAATFFTCFEHCNLANTCVWKTEKAV